MYRCMCQYADSAMAGAASRDGARVLSLKVRSSTLDIYIYIYMYICIENERRMYCNTI